jgi:sugar/nucleoside kinase (ribokinase family)
MIVVIGPTHLAADGSDVTPGGLAAGVAAAAAAHGGAVEAITKVGDDPDGDALLLGLARRGVGHVAVLRDAAHRTPVRSVRPDYEDPAGPIEPSNESTAVDDPPPDATGHAGSDAPGLEAADVGLALRYLTDYRVIVTTHAAPAIVAEAAAAADWAAAHLVVVTTPEEAPPAALPASAVVVESADDDEADSALASRLGAYAARVDGGADPGSAFAELTAVEA